MSSLSSEPGGLVPAATEPRPARSARGPIPRGEGAKVRIMRAALEVLTDKGMTGFSIEAVARHAGASKATIYRRWGSPTALLVDAMDLAFQPMPAPATGRLRSDLIELVSALEALLSDQPFPRLMAAVIDAAERAPDLSRLHQRLTERRRRTLRDVLAEAVELGEIPAASDLELAIDMLVGPAFYRRFIAHQPLPPGSAGSVVDHVLGALRSRPGDPTEESGPRPGA